MSSASCPSPDRADCAEAGLTSGSRLALVFEKRFARITSIALGVTFAHARSGPVPFTKRGSMKTIARVLLGALTTFVPVVIAACYGMVYKYNASGQVIDKDTHEGLSNIRVSCMANGVAEGEDDLSDHGAFYLRFNTPCTTLLAEDVAAADGGTDAGPDGGTRGRYAKKEVPYDNTSSGTIVIMMEKEAN